jgi:hypothetical protein
MRRALAAAAAVAALLAPAAGARLDGDEPGFSATVSRISSALAGRLVSWRPGCPVALADLRLVTVRHHGFDGRVRTGRLMVHEDVAQDVISVFRRLYEARFPISRMRLVDAYGADDFRSIEADNTSAFNCRRATGSSRWSLHAYGLAIDVNPIENPYVEDGRVYHEASRRYVDRSRRFPGTIREGDAVTRAFDAIGWGWGGRWPGGVKDYQHFSSTGR